MNKTSIKNHLYGCQTCEFCNNDRLHREDMSIPKITVWTCKECNSSHYWAWDNKSNYFVTSK